ncbi:MAG: hypothetical protein R2883_01735 [Caldisericia bacterium]
MVKNSLIAKGGRGGLGNVNFQNARRQSPHIATGGEKGEKYRLRIELKFLQMLVLLDFQTLENPLS